MKDLYELVQSWWTLEGGWIFWSFMRIKYIVECVKVFVHEFGVKVKYVQIFF